MVDYDYTSGQILPAKKDPQESIQCEQTQCEHKNLVPLELHFARVSYPEGYKNPPHYDYTANIVAANIARVKKYYCLDCRKEVNGPKRREK